MELILKLQNPIDGIGTVEVFEPKEDVEHTMVFPVIIDGATYHFFHNEDALWEIEEETLLNEEVIYLIGHLIEKAHL